jgi:hypothetical protein
MAQDGNTDLVFPEESGKVKKLPIWYMVFRFGGARCHHRAHQFWTEYTADERDRKID